MGHKRLGTTVLEASSIHNTSRVKMSLGKPKLRLVTYMCPGHPVELYELVLQYLEEQVGCESTLVYESRSAGPLPDRVDPFTADTVDIAFLSSSAYTKLLDTKNTFIELLPVTPVFSHPKNKLEEKGYYSDIIIHIDGSKHIQEFLDLRGTRWAYSNEDSLSSSIGFDPLSFDFEHHSIKLRDCDSKLDITPWRSVRKVEPMGYLLLKPVCICLKCRSNLNFLGTEIQAPYIKQTGFGVFCFMNKNCSSHAVLKSLEAIASSYFRLEVEGLLRYIKNNSRTAENKIASALHQLSTSEHYTRLMGGEQNGSGSHLNSVQMVLTKQAEASAVDANTLAYNKKYLQDGGKDVIVLESIGPLPPYPIVANKRLSAALKTKIVQALLKVSQKPIWVNRLKKYGVVKFVANNNDAYQEEREIQDAVKEMSFGGTYY
uniref:Uncharacterized protein n=1 Tax=Timema tahoe TaxID=61484 RepID=A0A7R9IHS1_9NEOP|nr:unnamed protein product [Timema tahoe]